MTGAERMAQLPAGLPLREAVYEAMRGAILQGDVRPGERLTEMRISQALGVSRTPVREAIRRLTKEGLIIAPPHRGAEVAGINPKHLQDVLEVRRALEELASETVCARIRDDGIRQLRQIHTRLREAMKSGDMDSITAQDEAFHAALYRFTENDELIRLLDNMRRQVFRFRFEYIKDRCEWDAIVREHGQIIDALAARDADKAREAMRAHISHQERAVREKILKEEAAV